MNRRKPIKKDYLAIFTRYSSRWLIGGGLIILAAFGLWLALPMGDSGSVAGEDIVAVLVMIFLPLLIIFVTLLAFEKTTGLSTIAGVEWVGEKTLALIDWGMAGVKSSLGIEPKKTSQRTTKPRHRSEQQAPILKSESNIAAAIEANIDTAANSEIEPVFSDFQRPEMPGSETILSTAFSDSDISGEDERQNGLESELLSVESSVDSPVITEIDKQESAIEPELENTASEAVIDSDTPANAQEETVAQDAQTEEGLEASFDEFETELKTFFQEKKDWMVDEAMPQAEDMGSVDDATVPATQALHEQLEADSPDVQVPGNKPDYMISALQAAKDKMIDSIDSEANSEQLPEAGSAQTSGENTADTASKSDESDYIIQALQEAAKNTLSHTHDDVGIKPDEQNTSSEDSPEHGSLLSQAEQTAASLFSVFSDKFSRSLGFHHQKPTGYKLPAIELLQEHQQSIRGYSAEELEVMSRTVERVLKDYKVIAEVAGAYPGPIITRFELSLAPGVKVSRVSGLAKDLARAMLVTSVRVVEIIEGTPYIGLEIPNQERELVSFREIISSDKFQSAASPITLALGKDVSGQTVVSDLAKMPHLLVAGTTGSGKSVAINTMILSMLYKATPDQVRMIMVDPKMLELSVYEGIPHLLTPVVTDMNEAQNALRWAVAEMERRYKLMSKVGVRNLAGFNQKIKDAEARGESIRDPLFQLIDPLQEGETFPVLSTLPSIVIVIDELADMMMIVGKKVEELIARLAQKARAAGIHLILATQRPSVDVLTGLIKANVPTRISFQVSSRIDSRTILDQGGAEALLGNGDMLFLPSGTSVPTRSHGAFVDDDEVHAVVNYLKSLGGANYLSEIIQQEVTEKTATAESAQDEVDALYNDAVSFVMETGRASISSIQRRFKVGYNRAARMIDQMEEEHIVSEPEGNGSRRLLDRE